MIKRGNWKSGLVASSVWELRLCFGRWTLQCLCCEAVTIRWENKWKTSNQLLVLFIIKGEGRERSSQDFNEHFFKRCRWWYTCFYAILLEHPTFAFSHRVPKSVLYIRVSFSVLHIGLSLPSFKIPCICISILYWSLSFWLTSLCIMGSSFMHLIRTDSNELFLMAE